MHAGKDEGLASKSDFLSRPVVSACAADASVSQRAFYGAGTGGDGDGYFEVEYNRRTNITITILYVVSTELARRW